MFKKILKGSLGATIFTLTLIWLLAQIEIDSDVFNPISKTFGDFEITDLVFSQFKENAPADTNVVLVNIGNLPREGIAALVNQLSPHKPKVIGIDAFFREPKSNDPEGDSALSDAFSRVENLVLVSKVSQIDHKTGIFDTLEKSHPIFTRHAHTGMSNMISEGYDKFKTSRIFSPYEKYRIKSYEFRHENHKVIRDLVVKDTVEPAFAAKLANYIDPGAVKKLMARNKSTEIINYSGNFVASGDISPNSKIVYMALDIEDVFNPDADLSFIKDKIVLMGYMGPSFHKVTWEDKFFTPLNMNYIGKANPDMYGVVVHANIITMILRGEYINDIPKYWTLAIGLMIIYLNILLLSYIYFKLEIWYDAIVLVLSFIQVIVFMALVIWLFVTFGYKMDIVFVVVALLLTGNLLEIYYGIIANVYSKIENLFLSLFFKKKRQVYED